MRVPILDEAEEKEHLQEKIAATNGSELDTQFVIAEALKCIRKKVLNSIERATGRSYDSSQVQWVLTVPAIWSQEVFAFFQKHLHL